MDKNLALETLKSFVENTDDVIAKDAILALHPELAESENERIIRMIKKVIYDCNEGNEHLIGDKDVVLIMDWLEKQKEQEPLSTEETELNSIAFLEQMGYTCIPPEKQKPAESEQLAKLREMTHEIRVAYEKGIKVGRGEVKPAEWSEEDEDMFACIIDDVKEINKTKKYKHQKEIGEMEIDWLKNRLKSLRPQPHWKPSEEQMDILDKIYHYLWADRNATADMQDGLGDLIDDLKKL